jgi:hypothetical protein
MELFGRGGSAVPMELQLVVASLSWLAPSHLSAQSGPKEYFHWARQDIAFGKRGLAGHR